MCKVRFLLLISVLFVSAGMWGADDGFTPTDGGLVVNLKPGQRILISTMVDHDNNPTTPDREYFVENYTRYTGDGYFTYDNKYSEGHHLKLVMQKEGATEPAGTSIWTVDTALTRIDVNGYAGGGKNKDYALGGISYTIWNDNRTLSTTNSNNRWQFWGDLVEGTTSDKLCDVVFVVPTDYDYVTSFDPSRTITNSSDVRMRNKPVQDSKGRFNGRTGIGFMGMAYREVYWLEIPLFHTPVSYNNSALVVFNTTNAVKTWGAGSIKPGCAGYAYNNKTHPRTPRTIFRLYILDEPFHSCPGTYSFAYDEQFTTKYRKSNTIGDSTGVKNVYTVDLSECMTRIPGTKYYQTDLMHVPEPDDSYYYVGWNDDYRHGSGGSPSERLGSSTAKSNFAPMSDLPLQYMPSSLKAPAGALGHMIVDTTSAADNLGVVFRPAGVFLKVDAGEGRYRNIEMHPEPGDTSWICNEMWTITDAYTALTIKATLYTQPTFSDSDPGQDIEGWSEYVVGTSVPLAGDPEHKVEGGMTGWARVYTNKSSKNGGLEFVQAEPYKFIRYNNNGHFGAEIPETHAVAGEDTAVVQDHRLINGYNFRGWYTKKDTTAGDGTWYKPGDVVTFTDSDDDDKDSLILYAQAKYEGGIGVAISFMKDGERYFMTHPGAQAPRYARARHFDDYTDTYQGMANADNIDPHYLTTYLLVGKNTICAECYPDEYVFDPKREMVKGGVDSLMFYENFAPDVEEYPGLYFTAPNVILANDTWAGLFKSSEGWPTPGDPCIESTKLSSTHYLSGFPSTITRVERGNNAEGSNIVYNEALNQFDATLSEGTDFMISGVGVVDEHYIVQPDTLDDKAVWNDTIEFGLHSGASSNRQVWSKLIGKQLLLQMTMEDGKIVYFHPNDAKTVTTATDLRVTNAYGLTQTFEYIRDARVESLGTVDEEDKPQMSTLTDDFGRRITSGLSSPKDVEYESKYIDIIDTIRIALHPTPKSKIKAYYGRWNDDAVGLKKSATGTRYRDVIVRTKTYHYGTPRTVLDLVPEHEVYSFNPLAGNERTVNFNLIRTTYRTLLDVNNKVVGEEAVSHDTINPSLMLAPSYCSFTSGGTYFEVPEAASQTATVRAKTLNKSTHVKDTMIVSVNVIIDAVTYPVTARVPMTQMPLEGDELVWSVESGGKRYFIMAGEDRLIFRQFQNKNGILYKNEDGKTALVRGADNPSNSDTKYITPWYFSYNPEDPSLTQIALKTKYSVNRYFKIPADEVGSVATVHPTDSSYLIFHYENVYTNDNANEEEQVKLQYGADKWLQFTVTGGSGPQLKLVGSKEEASVFSWSYLLREHSLLNNGTYPSRDSVVFGYNTDMTVAIQTRYKAYKEYSMLVGNKVVYCCREDENNVRNLINDEQEWRTNFDIDYIPDARDFDGEDPVSSGLSHSLDTTTLTTTVSTSDATTSPMNIKIGGKNVNIVDTLHVTLKLDKEAPTYRFKDKWSRFKSISDAELKIPLIRKVYHVEAFDSLKCFVEHDEYNYVFPNSITEPVEHEFVLGTERRIGNHVHDVYETSIAVIDVDVEDVTDSMKLNDIYKAQVRLIDETGKKPTWCRISAKSDHTITIECTESGIRTPRTAYVYVAYLIQFKGEAQPRFENFRFTVSQPSLYEYANNQVLVHNSGASGDPLDERGMQQVHQNKRILYYYPEQDVELPIRDAHFFGWWRWFREGEGEIGDSDIPQEVWRQAPVNTGTWNIPFRIIGDSVPVDPENPAAGKKLVTMGRYTVFHYRSSQYSNVRLDPPCKTALVAPPVTTYGEAIKPTVTYAVDISNYYDKLPMSVSDKNQVDRARLDTMRRIPEPTLSLREVFELHPWTEMAERLEGYKSTRTTNDAGEYELASERYMEDHVMMAPLGNQLLLKTEQRYNYANLEKGKHSESLLGYYMRDDNWSTPEWDAARKDTMIWCGGWDADCSWYTYNPKNKKYTPCDYKITQSDDYLIVPKRNNIPAGQEFDTVYYCLRARSWSTTGTPNPDPELNTEETDSGAYMFNICRYMIIYHNPAQYGPLKETKQGGVNKAIITNDEIEQRYEVLERLDFDYNKPGSDYTVYPHPLPWADASYGYTYPETSTLPHNRLHTQSDLPNFGEYGLVNRVHYTDYWHDMQQHGGAENGYMIYCDGMASSGQVAALSLETHLCAGQKMFFSGYVGNPYKSTEAKYARPNFIFTVQGSVNGTTWEDITSYTTGDLEPSQQWYQIFFPIIFNSDVDYRHFRVRIYNMASNWDGNDFVIDDMRIIATKPPLIAYHANTTCKEKGDEDTPTHILLRVDYQGITGEGYNNEDVYYTVKEVDKDRNVSFVQMLDHYLNEETYPKADDSKPDTICGKLFIPGKTYEPQHADSIFVNMQELIDTFNVSNGDFKEGYIYEILEGVTRPVKYVVHSAYVNPVDTFTVHMSAEYKDMLNSICGMTSYLEISNQMVLELNGAEQPELEILGLCANATYDIGLRVKGSLYLDNTAPIELNGTCRNDWLLYGDTTDAASLARYGYTYKNIVKVVKDILRCDPLGMTNANQFAPNLAEVNRNEMKRIMDGQGVKLDGTTDHPYDILAHLVNNGFLKLYQPRVTATVYTGDSVQYVIFPIKGTGTDSQHHRSVEVCDLPIFVKLKPSSDSEKVPLIVGGLHRAESELSQPVVVLENGAAANNGFKIRVDSIMPLLGIYSITLRSTDDPDFREGIHSLSLIPDQDYPKDPYYVKGDSILLRPAGSNNYQMREGYNYTYDIVMQSYTGSLTIDPEDSNSCRIGTVPFTLAVVPSYLRWSPQDENSTEWNNPANWLGIDSRDNPIHENARFAPLSTTSVLIPLMTDGKPYPELPAMPRPYADSIQQAGFQYNTCEAIRFLPGAAMSQQQRMDYEEAIIDMPFPHNEWAFRAAPVKGMISGDIFMANADIANSTPLWEVGAFDAAGRTHKTGNASFWLSLYSSRVTHQNSDAVGDRTEVADAEWSKVTNGLTLSLPPAQGFAVYARTASLAPAVVRLPKNDDLYYYYYTTGGRIDELYEHNLRDLRNTLSSNHAGELAFHPGKEVTSQSYTITKESESNTFVFGNPTMGYIDIWGFIADNSLVEEIGYMASGNAYTTVTKATAEETTDTISNPKRYLPPMHAMLVKVSEGTPASLSVTVNTNRILTSPDKKVPLAAPRRVTSRKYPKGIMTVTATNTVSPRCFSRLLVGQGYNDAVYEGEDAQLTTLNINNYTNNTTPATPFNLYAVEGDYGLCIDLRDSIVNIPLSFYLSDLPYDPVTHLWFTGVHNIEGELVLYDALTGEERTILDGICLDIATPEQNHERRYYIRRRGFNPDLPDETDPVTTGLGGFGAGREEPVKIIRNGHVFILRDGHVYTLFGQKIR